MIPSIGVFYHLVRVGLKFITSIPKQAHLNSYVQIPQVWTIPCFVIILGLLRSKTKPIIPRTPFLLPCTNFQTGSKYSQYLPIRSSIICLIYRDQVWTGIQQKLVFLTLSEANSISVSQGYRMMDLQSK